MSTNYPTEVIKFTKYTIKVEYGTKDIVYRTYDKTNNLIETKRYPRLTP